MKNRFGGLLRAFFGIKIRFWAFILVCAICVAATYGLTVRSERDRIGSGDAYVAGVLYGLLATGDLNRALCYGNAMSAIKNTVPGDLPDSNLGEIERIIRDHQTGSQSEMNR